MSFLGGVNAGEEGEGGFFTVLFKRVFEYEIRFSDGGEAGFELK